MLSFFYDIPFKIFLALLLSLLTGWFWYSQGLNTSSFKRIFTKLPPLTSEQLLYLGLFITLLIRTLYSQNIEQNVDMSSWIATAISAGKSNEPFWLLLNYADGRPLTVLPLALAELLGFEVTYRFAELIGVMLWGLTLVVFFYALRSIIEIAKAALLTFLIAMWIGSVWNFDYTGYNSEIVGNLGLMLSLYCVLRLANTTYFQLFLTGLCLGCLPFIKFQTAPMGIVLGFYGLYLIGYRWKSICYYLLGALVPLLLVTIIFWVKNDLPAFWYDYFGNYFYYSYTNEYAEATLNQRFTLPFLFDYVLKNGQSAVFWSGQVITVLIGLLLLFTQKTKINAHKHLLIFSTMWFLNSWYAVLQAGNQYDHYLLFLVFPSCWLIGVLTTFVSQRHKLLILSLIVGFIWIQSIVNTLVRHQEAPHPAQALYERVANKIQNVSQPSDKMVLWGYADGLYVLTRRPMGYRLPYTFWVYYKSSQQTYRINEFLSDMKHNEPQWFVDAMSPRLSVHSGEQYKWQLFPSIKSYVEQHYTLTDSLDEIHFWKRKP